MGLSFLTLPIAYSAEASEEEEEAALGDSDTLADAAPVTSQAATESQNKNLMKEGKNREEMQNQIKAFQEKLGIGGMSALTQETGALAEQQEQLMKQMANIGPLMQNAENLLKTFESSGMMKMVDKVLPFMEKLTLPGMGAAKK